MLGFITHSKGVVRWKTTRQLARLVRLCQDHENTGLMRGDKAYHELLAQAQQLIQQRCQITGETQRNIELQMPALRVMQELACPPQTVGRQKLGLGKVLLIAVIAFVLLPAAFGAVSGLYSQIYQQTAHFVQHIGG